MATQAAPLGSADWYAQFLAQNPQYSALNGINQTAQTTPAGSTYPSVQQPGQPQQLPTLPTYTGANSGTPLGPSGVGNPITGTPAASQTFTQVGQGGTGNDENDILQQAYNNQNWINQAGQQISQEGTGELNYYGNQQNTYDAAQAQALNALAATPGYTSAQAGQINTDYSQYNTPTSALNAEFLTPAQQAAIAGNPNAPVASEAQGTANEGAQLNAYEGDLSGQVGNNASYVGAANAGLDTGTSAAVGSLASGLQGAQSGFSSLNSAVDNPALAFDPNSTESQITPEQMQQMETAAGTTIGNQYGAAEDALRQNAAAAGNTSPLALAAANARLQTQEASQQGQASTQADIAANNAQYARAAAIEAQREGATQTQAGLQAGAATTEQSQAQNAAALAGTQGLSAAELAGQAGISAAENVGAAGINAANTYGNAALNQQTTMTNQDYSAQAAAEQLAAQRAATLATNQQGIQQNVNNTAYSQGVNSAQATSQGAQTVGNAQIAGQNNYRAGVQAQQNQAQQGVGMATGTQQSAYGTQTGGLNASTAAAGNMKTGQPSVLGDITAMASALIPKTPGSAKGEIITEPSLRRVGERGAEWIGPIGPRYRPQPDEDEEDSPAFNREAA